MIFLYINNNNYIDNSCKYYVPNLIITKLKYVKKVKGVYVALIWASIKETCSMMKRCIFDPDGFVQEK
jgi:hypothetical protein